MTKISLLLKTFTTIAVVSSLSIIVSAQDTIKGVVNLGYHGWLFLSQERLTFDLKSVPDLVSKLAVFNKYFRKNNTKVIFTIIPTKYELYGKFESKHSSVSEEAYPEMMRQFKQKGMTIVDANDVLSQARDRGILVWMRRDTHMSPQGGQLLGREIANHILANNYLNAKKDAKYSLSFKKQQWPSDLWRLVYPQDQIFYPQFEDIIVPEITFVKNQSEILEDFAPEVILIGTSYSIKPSNAIAVGLEQGLKSEVLNLGKDSGEIWGSMDYYLREQESKLRSPKIIVWEIPERVINDGAIAKYRNFPSILRVLEHQP